MVSALDSGSSGPGSSPGRGHCVVFLGRTLYSHSASLHPGVQMGTSKNAGGNPAMEQQQQQTPSCFMLMEPELSAGPIGHLACILIQCTTYKIQLYSSHNSSRTRNYYRLLSVSCLDTYTDVSFWLFLFQSFGIGRKVKKNEKLITMIIMIIQRSQSFTMMIKNSL